jgi:hypothetical protein
LAHPLEEEDEKPKIGGPTKESVTKLLVNKSKPQEGEEIRSRHRQVTKHIPRVRMSGVKEISYQSWDLVLLCESSQIPHSFIETLFL